MARGGEHELEQATCLGRFERRLARRRLPREASAPTAPHSFEQLAELLRPPSTIGPDGTRLWYDQRRLLHRGMEMPAVVYADGTREWWVDGLRHRDGGPAVVDADGSKEWWRNGRLHRDGDKPAAIYASGTREWWVDGRRHREDGPAVIWPNDDKRERWLRGERRRVGDKPVIVWANGR